MFENTVIRVTIVAGLTLIIGAAVSSCSGNSQAYDQGYSAGQKLGKAIQQGGSLLVGSNKAKCTQELNAWGGSTSQEVVTGFMTGCENELSKVGKSRNSSGQVGGASAPAPTPSWPQITKTTICQLLPGAGAKATVWPDGVQCELTWRKWNVSVVYAPTDLQTWAEEGNYRTHPLPGMPDAVYAIGIAGTGAQGNTAAAYPLSDNGTNSATVIVYGSGSSGVVGIQGSPNPTLPCGSI